MQDCMNVLWITFIILMQIWNYNLINKFTIDILKALCNINWGRNTKITFPYDEFLHSYSYALRKILGVSMEHKRTKFGLAYLIQPLVFDSSWQVLVHFLDFWSNLLYTHITYTFQKGSSEMFYKVLNTPLTPEPNKHENLDYRLSLNKEIGWIQKIRQWDYEEKMLHFKH